MTPVEIAEGLKRIATEMHQLEHPREDRLALPAAAILLMEAKRLLEQAQPPYFHQDKWQRARYAWMAGDVS